MKKDDTNDKKLENTETNTVLPSDQLETRQKQIRNRKRFLKAVWSTISGLIVVTAIAVIISTMMIPILRVTGSGMSPTLRNDELILCVKSNTFDRGNIVAFYYNNKILLKRVVALPGETIDFTEDGTVLINGEKFDEPYVKELAIGESDVQFPFTVPEGRLFLMGDNRGISIDSRTTTIGAVSTELIIGKVKMVVYPFDDIRKVQ